MPKESPSQLEQRIEALNARIESEKDPALIRALTKDMIALESQLQQHNRKSKS